MHRPSRHDGSTSLTEGSGDPAAAGTAEQTPCSNHGERSCGRPGSGGGGGGEGEEPQFPHLSRPERRKPPPKFRRVSSGYFSSEGDSVPNTPLSPRPVTAGRATQTPSPTAQAVNHAQWRLKEAHDGGPGPQHGNSASPSSPRQHHAPGDMQAVAVGRELRHIGDDFNDHILRGVAGGHGRVDIYPNHLPHIHQDPAFLLIMGLLLVLIGRYFQERMSSRNDHTEV